jgi:hypothetical protein
MILGNHHREANTVTEEKTTESDDGPNVLGYGKQEEAEHDGNHEGGREVRSTVTSGPEADGEDGGTIPSWDGRHSNA